MRETIDKQEEMEIFDMADEFIAVANRMLGDGLDQHIESER